MSIIGSKESDKMVEFVLKRKRKRRIPTQRIQRENNLYYRYQILSAAWKDYAELLSFIDLIGKKKMIDDAMEEAAKYKRKAISIDEELLLAEEREQKK